MSFQRQGAELYRGSLILPIIGVVDGMRPGVCSVSVNTRHKNAQQQPIGAKAAIYSSFEGGMVKMLRRNWDSFLLGNFGGSEFAPAGSQPTTVSHLLRKTLETTHSFGAAVRTLSTVPQGGLSYIAVAGTKKGEGAVITRSRRCAADVRTLFDYGAKNASFWSNLYIYIYKMSILPRQARDKHRENSEKSGVFLRGRRHALGARADEPRPLAGGPGACRRRGLWQRSRGPCNGANGAGAAWCHCPCIGGGSGGCAARLPREYERGDNVGRDRKHAQLYLHRKDPAFGGDDPGDRALRCALSGAYTKYHYD